MNARYKFNQCISILKQLDLQKSIPAAEIIVALARLHKHPETRFASQEEI
jgi:hypothetical protein